MISPMMTQRRRLVGKDRLDTAEILDHDEMVMPMNDGNRNDDVYARLNSGLGGPDAEELH